MYRGIRTATCVNCGKETTDQTQTIKGEIVCDLQCLQALGQKQFTAKGVQK